MQHASPQRPGTTQGAGPLSRLERVVLNALLKDRGTDGGDVLAGLRAQLERASVISRTHSGVGFVTRLAVPAEVPPVPDTVGSSLRPVLAAHPALPGNAEFLLQLKGGRLAVLEAYCYEGGWPADEAEFRVVG